MGGAVAGDLKRRMLSGDGNGVGGFYEAILALMVVTLGVMLLTASFAFLAVRDASSGDGDLGDEAREIMDSLLSDLQLFGGDRAAERSDLARLSQNEALAAATLGVKVMITEIGGGTEVLYQNGDPKDMKERASLGEPVNVKHSGGDVRAASLTVWVWR